MKLKKVKLDKLDFVNLLPKPGKQGIPGEPGEQGEPGRDYVITSEDKEKIRTEIIDLIPKPEDGKPGEPGKDAVIDYEAINDYIDNQISQQKPAAIPNLPTVVQRVENRIVQNRIVAQRYHLTDGSITPWRQVGSKKTIIETTAIASPGGGGDTGGTVNTDVTLTGDGSVADPLGAIGVHRYSVETGEILNIPANYQFDHAGAFEINGGILEIEGRMAII